jgi:hypothetical protein
MRLAADTKIRWVSRDRPHYEARWDVLLAGVQAVLAEREEAYPQWIAAGRMSQDQADDGLRISRSIVADWQRIVNLRAGLPAAPRDREAGNTEKRLTYAHMLRRAESMMLRVRDAYWQALPASARADLLSGNVSIGYVRDHWKAHHHGYNAPEIGVFFAEYRRYCIAEALVWHAQSPRGPMFWAECQAGLLACYRLAADKAA